MPTLMVRHATDAQIQQALNMSGEKTGSKALVACVEMLSILREKHHRLEEKVIQTESELQLAKVALSNARESASNLLRAVDHFSADQD